jgi:hypothetical protein
MKIPFAIDRLSRDLVDVGRVKAGRSCDCLCPSCSQGVIARKGDVNSWHFAHDKESLYAPTSNCEISFYSCCRAFVVYQATHGKVSTLMVPEYKLTETDTAHWTGITECGTVTEPKPIVVSELSKDGPYDLLARIGNYNLFIYLLYPERDYPRPLESGKDGLLLIDLKFIGEQFPERPPSSSLMVDLVVELFETEELHKEWIYHPNEIYVRREVKKRLEEKVLHSQQQGADTHVDVIDLPLSSVCEHVVSCHYCDADMKTTLHQAPGMGFKCEDCRNFKRVNPVTGSGITKLMNRERNNEENRYKLSKRI